MPRTCVTALKHQAASTQGCEDHIGGPLDYASAQELWAKYNRLADEDIGLHQLRHTHATELVNGGVSLQTIRKRLGHRKIQTSLRYAALRRCGRWPDPVAAADPVALSRRP